MKDVLLIAIHLSEAIVTPDEVVQIQAGLVCAVLLP
jgi:hypothetical protein